MKCPRCGSKEWRIYTNDTFNGNTIQCLKCEYVDVIESFEEEVKESKDDR